MYNKKQAFTLIELIITTIILAILGTISVISIQSYSKATRDSVRINDMAKIEKSLELFQQNASKYPESTDFYAVTYSGSEAWVQGTFGGSTFTNIEKLD
ncbi:MAG: prepilin-type N-terminal cleavage/methylation domain-containing protein, partial [Candidatus Gracilibacteria bacterium]